MKGDLAAREILILIFKLQPGSSKVCACSVLSCYLNSCISAMTSVCFSLSPRDLRSAWLVLNCAKNSKTDFWANSTILLPGRCLEIEIGTAFSLIIPARKRSFPPSPGRYFCVHIPKMDLISLFSADVTFWPNNYRFGACGLSGPQDPQDPGTRIMGVGEVLRVLTY
jgi:hypothetical protein